MPSSAAQDAGDPGTPTDPEGSLHKNLGLVELSEYPPIPIGMGIQIRPVHAIYSFIPSKKDLPPLPFSKPCRG